MDKIQENDTLGSIVTRFPYTTKILNKYKLDYSFNGNDTLIDALQDNELEEEDILGELNLAVDEFKLMHSDVLFWENEPISAIVDHIEYKHHAFMKETISEINTLLGSGPIDGCPEGLAEKFLELEKDVLRHQSEEEMVLFPLLRSYSEERTTEKRHEIIKYMNDMEAEHDDVGEIFKEINRLTDDFETDSFMEPALISLYEKMDALEKDTFLHIHMENSILFKMI